MTPIRKPITFHVAGESESRLLCTTDFVHDPTEAMLNYSGHRWATSQDLRAAGYIPDDHEHDLSFDGYWWVCPCGLRRRDNAAQKVQDAVGLLSDALTIDGSHHKQWYIEQALTILDARLIAEADDHEAGIAP